MSFNVPRTKRKRVIIVGGGFGGLKLAERLKGSQFQVVLVDRNNYHQFLPLIYQVASAGIEPTSISFPFRKIFQGRKNFFFRLAEVRSIDPEHNRIQTSIGKADYDYLVLAAGTTSNFFGNARIEQAAIPMKDVSEAMGLRNALLSNYERAVTCSTGEERRELLTVVIVGGGATGVEIAGALSEMKRFVIPKDYPEIKKSELRLCLIEAGDRLLAGMSREASDHAKMFLEEMGIEVKLNTKVTDYDNYAVVLETGERIPTRSFIWVSGITAVHIGNLDESLLGRGKRITVDEFNRVRGMANVFAIGDQCIQPTDDRYPNGHPQVAQVAIQQGELLACNLRRERRGAAMQPFRYKDLGSMATLGRNRAVADLGRIRLHGWLAWMIWLVVHLRSILGIRNRLLILMNWTWNYFTYDQSLRLIIREKKAPEIEEREALEQHTHWGKGGGA